jgi:hypothetical protein
MSERFDALARTLASRTPRRMALLGLGSLGLGSLGILGVGQGSEAKKNNNLRVHPRGMSAHADVVQTELTMS